LVAVSVVRTVGDGKQVASMMIGTMPSSLTLATALLVTVAALHDFRTRRIPNQLVLAGCGLGIFLNTWATGLPGLATSVAGFGLGLVLMLPGFLLRFTGGGDVKLLAAVGGLLGPERILYAFVFSVIVGGAVAIVQSLYAWAVRGAASPATRYGAMMTAVIATRRLVYIRPDAGEALGRRFPLAPAIAVGSIAASLLAV
jgi:prepilin peptidase CpaA